MNHQMRRLQIAARGYRNPLFERRASERYRKDQSLSRLARRCEKREDARWEDEYVDSEKTSATAPLVEERMEGVEVRMSCGTVLWRPGFTKEVRRTLKRTEAVATVYYRNHRDEPRSFTEYYV